VEFSTQENKFNTSKINNVVQRFGGVNPTGFIQPDQLVLFLRQRNKIAIAKTSNHWVIRSSLKVLLKVHLSFEPSQSSAMVLVCWFTMK
jgi:hypothetical protein